MRRLLRAQMYPHDTIAAIATPPGTGGIAIVRVSGRDAGEVARKVFRGMPGAAAESHRVYAGRIVAADGKTIDRGLCVLMFSPRSYTGEDVAELHCHGGMLVARSVLAAALAAGARAARRGEFTLRAFLNGKLDLAQAESVADLISAKTSAAMEAATAQLEGALSQAVEKLRERVVGVSARLEVAIDFSEEDVGELDRRSLAEETATIASDVRRLAATFARGRILREGLRVAIVGKPNAGKSSLLNSLLQSERAIVTAVPGTTRDVLEETADLGGIPLILVDTAGIRVSTDTVERIGIERSHREITSADVTLVMLDASRPFESEDQAVLDATRQNRRILLINKVDLERQLLAEEVEEKCPGESVSLLSVESGLGIEALCDRLTRLFAGDSADAGNVVVTRERQCQALDGTATSLDAAVQSLRIGHPPDVVAVDVLCALDHLGELVGKTSPEAVLDRIFSEFCIGK